MLDPQKTLEREALLRRHRELQAEIAQLERNMREGEARLPIEEQLRLKLRRFIEANIPDLNRQGSAGETALRLLRISLWLSIFAPGLHSTKYPGIVRLSDLKFQGNNSSLCCRFQIQHRASAKGRRKSIVARLHGE